MGTNENDSIFLHPPSISPLRVDAYDYALPEELIATTPSAQREDARLLIVDPSTAKFTDMTFNDLPDYFEPGDLILFNNTRVLSARIYAKKHTGGRVELLVLDVVHDQLPADATTQNRWQQTHHGQVRLHTMTRTSKPLKVGQHLTAEEDDQLTIEVLACSAGRATVSIAWKDTAESLLEHLGQLPLPPYIVRQRKAQGMDTQHSIDQTHYQTVFAKHPGAVAAPTASLHFGPTLLERLQQKQVEVGFVTLHVGIGTFKPVDVDRLDEHPMHSERYMLDEKVCEQIRQCKSRGGRVIAVGTTTARVLETEARKTNGFQPVMDETDIFLHPDHPLIFCDGLITNFHLPRSTLLALVAGAMGYQTMRHVYEHAVAQQYQFYSYGDGMFIRPIRHGASTPDDQDNQHE